MPQFSLSSTLTRLAQTPPGSRGRVHLIVFAVEMDKVLFDPSNPNDISEIRLILLDDDANKDPALVEDLGEESDLDSQDEVEQHEDESATEQEEGTTEEEEEDIRTGNFIVRDKQTKWTRKPSPAAACRIQCHSIITHLPGVRGEAENAKTTLQCWECLFNTEMLELLVENTNKYIDSVKAKFARERDAKGTGVIEIKALIGLLYLAGAYRGNWQSQEELWGIEGDWVEKFGLANSPCREVVVFLTELYINTNALNG
ncbi:uncharacterized protein LOC124155206 [Ischnura elegans]|uniref:uncharacterized protein LOC124155206 n=1 Tax=Ischnura elegans TaxID=197161 RepID=UPI001ED8BD13|nr:uncharacterized protein LOC124155206 [Ischnura elegans]